MLSRIERARLEEMMQVEIAYYYAFFEHYYCSFYQ